MALFLLALPAMADLSYRFAHEAFQELSKSKDSSGQTCSDIINSAQTAKKFARKRGDDPETARLRAYAKSWLALDELHSAQFPRPVSQGAPAPPFPDQNLANTLLHPGRGQIVPVPIVQVQDLPTQSTWQTFTMLASLFTW